MQGLLHEAATAMGGELIAAGSDARWVGAALDSRRVEGGELFFALPGEQTDGHRFVESALERGAAAAVVSRQVNGAGPLIRVDDGTAALHALTHACRERAPEHLIAVTGSSGKTTTKEILAAMLGQRFRVGRSPGNLNNLYGFPLALLGIDDDAQWMVAEMGMSTPGELGQISRLGRPDIAVFTNVKAAHLEAFGTLRRIAEAKAELLQGLTPGGTVIANADDPEVLWIASRHDGPLVTYAMRVVGADVQATALEPLQPFGTRFVLEVAGTSVTVELPLHGRYNVENCLAAAAAALAAGLTLDEIAQGVKSLAPARGRGEILQLPGGITLVDDSYNSNPSALSSALEAAAGLSGRRRWAVLGEMLELGEAGEEFHRTAGREAVAAGFDPIHTVGAGSWALCEAAREAGAESNWWPTVAEAIRELPAPVAGDVVLVKGSRGIGLEKVVAHLAGGTGSAGGAA